CSPPAPPTRTARRPVRPPSPPAPSWCCCSRSSPDGCGCGTTSGRGCGPASSRRHPARRPPMPEPVLVARGATKAYADLVALAPLDLTVRAGELVALVGHNGSGKSTFLRLAAGLLELTDG